MAKVSVIIVTHNCCRAMSGALVTLKRGMLFESARVALAGAHMYPLSMDKSILSLSTLRSLKSGVEKYWRAQRT